MNQEFANLAVSSTGDGRLISVTGKGHLLDFQATNDDVDVPVYLQLFDQNEPPGTGQRPKRTFEVPAGGQFDGNFSTGRPYKLGLCLAFSSTRNTFTRSSLVASTGRVGAIEATFLAKEGQ